MRVLFCNCFKYVLLLLPSGFSVLRSVMSLTVAMKKFSPPIFIVESEISLGILFRLFLIWELLDFVSVRRFCESFKSGEDIGGAIVSFNVFPKTSPLLYP